MPKKKNNLWIVLVLVGIGLFWFISSSGTCPPKFPQNLADYESLFKGVDPSTSCLMEGSTLLCSSEDRTMVVGNIIQEDIGQTIDTAKATQTPDTYRGLDIYEGDIFELEDASFIENGEFIILTTSDIFPLAVGDLSNDLIRAVIDEMSVCKVTDGVGAGNGGCVIDEPSTYQEVDITVKGMTYNGVSNPLGWCVESFPEELEGKLNVDCEWVFTNAQDQSAELEIEGIYYSHTTEDFFFEGEIPDVIDDSINDIEEYYMLKDNYGDIIDCDEILGMMWDLEEEYKGTNVYISMNQYWFCLGDNIGSDFVFQSNSLDLSKAYLDEICI